MRMRIANIFNQAFHGLFICCLIGLGTVPGTASAASVSRIKIAADGRSFITEQGRPFVPFGVNYFRPGTGWAPQLWKQFDLEATRADFARMKESGVNCVRVFLTFGSFYREPGILSEDGLRKWDQFLGLAEDAGIYVHPTGPDHWEGVPDWARTDRLADDHFLSALDEFWKLFAARYRNRPIIFAFDLLNEPAVQWNSPALEEKWHRWLNQKYESSRVAAETWQIQGALAGWPQLPIPLDTDPNTRRLLDYQLFREQIAEDWTRRQATAIRSVDLDALVTVGLIQWSVPAVLPGARHYSGFRPDRQAPLLDFLEIHFYPLADGFYEYNLPDGELRNLAYLESVVREVGRPGKPVIVAEFGWYGGGKLTIDGGRHPPASQADQARWCRRAVETTAGQAQGWLNWGFYDQPEAGDVSQLIGLRTASGEIKEWGREFLRLSREIPATLTKRFERAGRPQLPWNQCLVDGAARRRFLEDTTKAFKDHPPGLDSPTGE